MRRSSLVVLVLGCVVLGAVVAVVSLRGSAPGSHRSSAPGRGIGTLAALQEPTPPPRGTSTLRGRVLREDQRPVSGAEVSASWVIPGETLSARSCDTGIALGLTSALCGQTPRARMIHALIEGGLGAAPVLSRAITSADGTFLLKGLPEGSVALWVLSSEGVALKLDVATGQQDVTLVLAPGLPGMGRVVDEHLVPVANVRVTLFLAEHSRYFQTVTDGDGRFTLGRLPHRDSRRSDTTPAPRGGEDSRWRYGLTLSSPGLVPVVRNDRFLDELASEDIVMHRARSIAGQVLLDDRPVAGALVDTFASSSPLETDEQGHFLLEGVAPGHFLFSARHGPHRGREGVLLREEQTEAEVTVRLGTLFQVVGTVRDDEGQLIPNAVVYMTSQRDPILGGTNWTNADGRFVYEYVNPGPVSFVTGQVDGYLVSERVDRDVTFATAPVELVMKRASVMEGVLTNTQGEPVPGGELTAMRWTRGPIPPEPPGGPFADGLVHQATADEQGRFGFDLPEPGLYLITAQADGFIGTHLGATAPSSAVKVVIRAAAKVQGVVVDASGEPVEGAFLSRGGGGGGFQAGRKRDRSAGEVSLREGASGAICAPGRASPGGVLRGLARSPRGGSGLRDSGGDDSDEGCVPRVGPGRG